MKQLLLMFCMLIAFTYVSAQENNETVSAETTAEGEDPDAYFIEHIATMKETMIMISRRYMVDPHDIYEYNDAPEASFKGGEKVMVPLHKSHKKNLDAFIKELEKKKGGPVRVPAPLSKKEKAKQLEEEKKQKEE